MMADCRRRPNIQAFGLRHKLLWPRQQGSPPGRQRKSLRMVPQRTTAKSSFALDVAISRSRWRAAKCSRASTPAGDAAGCQRRREIGNCRRVNFIVGGAVMDCGHAERGCLAGVTKRGALTPSNLRASKAPQRRKGRPMGSASLQSNAGRRWATDTSRHTRSSRPIAPVPIRLRAPRPACSRREQSCPEMPRCGLVKPPPWHGNIRCARRARCGAVGAHRDARPPGLRSGCIAAGGPVSPIQALPKNAGVRSRPKPRAERLGVAPARNTVCSICGPNPRSVCSGWPTLPRPAAHEHSAPPRRR